MNCRHFFGLVGALTLVGCATETIVHSINEKEANFTVELLADNDINATKIMNAAGRIVVYDIAVPVAQRIPAITILNQHELPKRQDKGYQEIFSEGGLIPTASEEKAKKLAALEGEIERQIKLIEGVLDVQVQLVIPDESALRTTQDQEPDTTASVTVKYLPGANGARPVSEPEIQAIVSAGVEKLLPEKVVVLMRPANGPPASVGIAKPTGLPGLGQKTLLIGLVVLLVFIALLGLGLLFTTVRLKTVRGRLIRLQTEIAKARSRKGSGAEALPASASAPGQGVL